MYKLNTKNNIDDLFKTDAGINKLNEVLVEQIKNTNMSSTDYLYNNISMSGSMYKLLIDDGLLAIILGNVYVYLNQYGKIKLGNFNKPINTYYFDTDKSIKQQYNTQETDAMKDLVFLNNVGNIHIYFRKLLDEESIDWNLFDIRLVSVLEKLSDTIAFNVLKAPVELVADIMHLNQFVDIDKSILTIVINNIFPLETKQIVQNSDAFYYYINYILSNQLPDVIKYIILNMYLIKNNIGILMRVIYNASDINKYLMHINNEFKSVSVLGYMQYSKSKQNEILKEIYSI